MKIALKTTTPCIGICSTVFGDQVCRGCKRFMHEISQWGQYKEEEKDLVWQRLEQQMILAVRQIVELVNQVRLEQQLKTYKIQYPDFLDPHCWIIYLLRSTKNQLTDLVPFGVEIRAEYRHLNFVELYNLLNEKWLALSLAHYDIQVNRYAAFTAR